MTKFIPVKNSKKSVLCLLSTGDMNQPQTSNVERYKRTLGDNHSRSMIEHVKKHTIKNECGDHPEIINFKLVKEAVKLYLRQTVSLDNIKYSVIFGDSLSDSQGYLIDGTHNLLPSYS